MVQIWYKDKEMRKNKHVEDITQITNPMEIKHFLCFGAYFHIQINKKTRPCIISLVDVPVLSYSGIIAVFEDGANEFFDFKDFNRIWQIGFSV